MFILTQCTPCWTGERRMRVREVGKKRGKKRWGEWGGEGKTNKEIGQMQQTEAVSFNLLLTCTKAWTAWTCPAILKLSSPSLQNEESKEHDVSMLTRQWRFRALYSTRFISRPRPYKN